MRPSPLANSVSLLELPGHGRSPAGEKTVWRAGSWLAQGLLCDSWREIRQRIPLFVLAWLICPLYNCARILHPASNRTGNAFFLATIIRENRRLDSRLC